MSARDGGYGWVNVGVAATAHFVAFGLLLSFGVFFSEIQREFGRGAGATAWVVSLEGALMLGASGPAGLLAHRFGTRRVMAVGTVLVALGLLGTSRATTIWHVYLGYGIAVGLGNAMCIIPALSSVGRWFERRRGLAVGLSVAGSGIGSMVLAPLSRALISAYGWRTAVVVMSAIAFGLLTAAATLVRGEVAGSHVPGVLRSLAGSRTFRLLYMSSVVGAFGYWVPFVFIVKYAEAQGVAPTRAALLVAVMGIGNTSGRIVMGAVADRVGRLRIIQVAAAGMATAVFLWPLAHSFATLSVFGIAFGLSAGAFIALLPTLTADYFGVERLAAATGAIFTAAAFGTLLGSPVSGFLVDRTGSYTTAIVLSATTLVLSGLALLPLPDPRATTAVDVAQAPR